MQVAVIGSGSKGNALLVEGGGARVLIDCGLTPKELRARLQHVGRALADVDAILVTHGHADHVSGARLLAGAFRLLTYATPRTHKFLGRTGGVTHLAPVTPDEPFRIRDLEVRAFSTPHDAPGSVGFVLTDGDARFALCTDLGSLTPDVERALSDVDTLMLEFNHDEDMLKRGPYPMPLKRRILAPTGHLSNVDAAKLLGRVAHGGLRRVVLAHLSEVNNTPDRALDAARAVTDERVELVVAPQHAPTDFIPVGDATGPRVPSSSSSRPHRAPRPAPPRLSPSPTTASATTSVAVSRQLSLFGGKPS